MKQFFAVAAFIFSPILSLAENNVIFVEVTKDTDLSSYQWTHRPIVVFANSPEDVNYTRQIKMLESGLNQLLVRDVVVLTDTNPSEVSPLRELLRPRGFALLLIGKDGQVKLRKPFPWSVRELSRAIDKMPMRRQELNAIK
ncbi:MAG: DUF4174 domain-containing protein [Proteobacteria bacterium]|jgi:hypothetical protein|nr:DUF4174 domain-containing protein [Pseudomonadota bacterium]MDA0852666.1 DUF4174 domain-containing protein [Pseudomonadota bacterium]MDA1295208.1 DUF4174 domain-containing protein [Pseudomonadota bacterium]